MQILLADESGESCNYVRYSTGIKNFSPTNRAAAAASSVEAGQSRSILEAEVNCQTVFVLLLSYILSDMNNTY